MVYAVLLDVYQAAPDQYGVSYSGTFDYCDSQTNVPTSTESWAKSDYNEPRFVKPKSLGGQNGRIVELIPVVALIAVEKYRPPNAVSMTLSMRTALLAALAGGAAVAVAIVLRKGRRLRGTVR